MCSPGRVKRPVRRSREPEQPSAPCSDIHLSHPVMGRAEVQGTEDRPEV